MPAHRHAQLDSAQGQQNVRQREVINRHLVALRIKLAQKWRKAANGKRGFKRKVLFGSRQRFQTGLHDAAGLHCHCVRIPNKQVASNVVRIHEGIDAQRCHNGVCVSGFASAVGAGEDDDAG